MIFVKEKGGQISYLNRPEKEMTDMVGKRSDSEDKPIQLISDNGDSHGNDPGDTAVGLEGEESRVGETEPTQMDRDNDSRKQAVNNGPIDTNGTNKAMDQNVDLDQGVDLDNGSSNLSVPFGFERITNSSVRVENNHLDEVRKTKRGSQNGGKHARMTVLRLSDQIKEKARRLKELRKQKRASTRRSERKLKLRSGSQYRRLRKEIPRLQNDGGSSGWETKQKGGLRRGGKMGCIRDMVNRNAIRMVGIAETKMNKLKDFEIRRLWGNLDFQWEAVNSVNSSGGPLCV
ncbi:hypothetical protein PIB30_039889 [Stylosanthes scabra]|uniref:Uncharacterized protein n=1 Tax=Stylosanthes scabra TaxID=79078 RepID=A0ABU6XCI8_9FABA|nr:hypothetical protein [Stylosanthes scabra]